MARKAAIRAPALRPAGRARDQSVIVPSRCSSNSMDAPDFSSLQPRALTQRNRRGFDFT
jgi:hypothetical protein